MIMIMLMMKIQLRDGGTNFILRIKEQKTRLTLQERDDDDVDDKQQKLREFTVAILEMAFKT